jgi:hypothetical protein
MISGDGVTRKSLRFMGASGRHGHEGDAVLFIYDAFEPVFDFLAVKGLIFLVRIYDDMLTKLVYGQRQTYHHE